MGKAKLNRRDFLRVSALTAAGAALAACGPTPTPETVEVTVPVEQTVVVEPTQPPTPTTVPPEEMEANIVYMGADDGSMARVDTFNARYPKITVEFVEEDPTRFAAMMAAGNPPDVRGGSSANVPYMLLRNWLLDLTGYFEVSDVLKPDDLAPVNAYFQAMDPLHIGEGNKYGVVKDWSPDRCIWVNSRMFSELGVTPPADDKRLTYQEILEMARQLVKFEGDRLVNFGFSYYTAWTERFVNFNLMELGRSLYVDGFTKVNIVDDGDANASFKLFYDMAAERLVASTLVPSPSWSGGEFAAQQTPWAQWGYWFGAFLKEQMPDQVAAGTLYMIPAPIWSGAALNNSIGPFGFIVSKATKVPDAAWRVVEWDGGQEPAVFRSLTGYGVPGLMSMYQNLPQETPFEQQCYGIMTQEAELATQVLQFNPFIGEFTFNEVWSKYTAQALNGEITFDEALQKTQEEVNGLIKEGVDRM
jgi:ABC-type glycerol-3-phosphate transport system substrate-binding protein